MSTGGELWPGASESVSATAQHIRLIQQKRERLAEALAEAERQYLTAVLREWNAGEMTYSQLSQSYDLICNTDSPGRSYRWNEIMPFSVQKVRAQAAREPDPDGTWRGTNPIADGHAYPLSGVPVVYILFDQSEPVYVGSSIHFKDRLENHRKNGKIFTYWEAHPCRDREHAYEVEASFLSHYMPKLNIQGPQRRRGAAA